MKPSRIAFAALAVIVWPTLSLAQAAAPVAPTAPAAATVAPAAAAAPAVVLPASPNMVAMGDMVSTLVGSGHFTVLVKALEATQLTPVLKSTPDLTLFAPTDEAFNALPAGQLSYLMAPKNVQVLQKLLMFHLVHLNIDSSKIKGAKGPVQTVEAGQVVVDGSTEILKVNDADIIQADVHATNGFIHVVDKVLIPTDVALPAARAAAPAAPATGG